MNYKYLLLILTVVSFIFLISAVTIDNPYSYNLIQIPACGNGCTINGDLNVTGNFTGNQIYGFIWGHDIGVITINTQNVYENISNLSLGFVNGFGWSQERNNTLIVQFSGLYNIISPVAFTGTANTEYHFTLGVNGQETLMCHTERKIGTGNDVGSASFACFERLEVGQEITIMVKNINSAANINPSDIQLTLVRIGN